MYGSYFRSKRIERGLSQRQLAHSLGFAASQHVSNVERGLAKYSLASVMIMIKTLGLDQAEIVNLIMREEEVRIRRVLGVRVKKVCGSE